MNALGLLRISLGLIFLASSPSKLRYPRIFAESLLAYEVLPPSLVTVVAVTLPWLELLAGLALLLGIGTRGGALVVGGLSSLFFAVVTSALWRGLDISCGCFVGVDWATVNWGHAALNLVLLSLAAAVYLKGPKTPSQLEESAPPRTLPV